MGKQGYKSCLIHTLRMKRDDSLLWISLLLLGSGGMTVKALWLKQKNTLRFILSAVTREHFMGGGVTNHAVTTWGSCPGWGKSQTVEQSLCCLWMFKRRSCRFAAVHLQVRPEQWVVKREGLIHRNRWPQTFRTAYLPFIAWAVQMMSPPDSELHTLYCHFLLWTLSDAEYYYSLGFNVLKFPPLSNSNTNLPVKSGS